MTTQSRCSYLRKRTDKAYVLLANATRRLQLMTQFSGDGHRIVSSRFGILKWFVKENSSADNVDRWINAGAELRDTVDRDC